MSTSGKVLFVFVSVSAVLLYVGALLEAPLSVALSTSEASGIRGGTATCYVDGTGNCPASVGCNETDCPGATMTCPDASQRKNTQMRPTFDLAAGTTTDPGHEGTNNQPPVVCLREYVCALSCRIVNIVPLVKRCQNGVPTGPTTTRIPTKVDLASRACNVP